MAKRKRRAKPRAKSADAPLYAAIPNQVFLGVPGRRSATNTKVLLKDYERSTLYRSSSSVEMQIRMRTTYLR